jgi:rSAM/selenodomain-associated transferase 2
MRLSIIIPTLNEAQYLAGTVSHAVAAARAGPHQILVADCASSDGTPVVATRLGVPVVPVAPPHSRARALNTGAESAEGEVLLFLDADSRVPAGYDAAIAKVLRDPSVVGGAFEFALDGPELGLRLVEIINRVRYRFWPWYYGDQGIFVRRDVFERMGGYRERRLLEASDFCRRLRLEGRVVLIPHRLNTSPRRFRAGGIYRVFARDVWIWVLDWLGCATEHLGAAYQDDNLRRGAPAGRVSRVTARCSPSPGNPP